MNNNHKNKLIKLLSLENAQQIGKLQELSLDEVASIQGGFGVLPFLELTEEQKEELGKLWQGTLSPKDISPELRPFLPIIL